jgi:hypothetical protein
VHSLPETNQRILPPGVIHLPLYGCPASLLDVTPGAGQQDARIACYVQARSRSTVVLVTVLLPALDVALAVVSPLLVMCRAAPFSPSHWCSF